MVIHHCKILQLESYEYPVETWWQSGHPILLEIVEPVCETFSCQRSWSDAPDLHLDTSILLDGVVCLILQVSDHPAQCILHVEHARLQCLKLLGTLLIQVHQGHSLRVGHLDMSHVFPYGIALDELEV